MSYHVNILEEIKERCTDEAEREVLDDAIELYKNPRPVALWMHKQNNTYACTNCGEAHTGKARWCENCGAKMLEPIKVNCAFKQKSANSKELDEHTHANGREACIVRFEMDLKEVE